MASRIGGMSKDAQWEEVQDFQGSSVKRLSANGKKVCKLDEAPWATAIVHKEKLPIGSNPKSGAGVTQREWSFAVRQMQSKMAIGVAQVARLPRRSWDEAQHVDFTWYWSSNSVNGYLAKGNQFVQATPGTFSKDSRVFMTLDVLSGKLSFSLLSENGKQQLMGSIEGVHGEVVPAVGLQTEGDLVEISPDDTIAHGPESPLALQRAGSPSLRPSGTSTFVDRHSSDEKTRTVKMQTAWEGSNLKACFFGHASAIWQVERSLQNAEMDIASLSRLNLSSMTETNTAKSGIGALTRAHNALLEVKAALYTSSVPHHQVKVVNLDERMDHAEVEALFGSVCRVVSVACKTDSDFLHPRDRNLTAGSCGKMNLVAFVTVNGRGEVAKAMTLDGKEVHGRKISVTAMEPLPLDSVEERNGQSGNTRREKTYAMLAKLEGQMGRWVRQLEGATEKAVDLGMGRVQRGDVEGAKRYLERARYIAAHLPHAKYTGALERMDQDLGAELQGAEAKLVEEKREMKERWATEVEREIAKLRRLLEVRGELRGSLQAQLRERREELERQGREEEARLVRLYESSKTSVLSKGSVAKEELLASRIADLEKRINNAYPELSYSSLHSLMQRLDWLLDDAEGALREFANRTTTTGLIEAWGCVLAAKAIASSPLPHSDIAALLPPLPSDMDHPSMEKLNECFETLHVPLHLQPASKRLLAEITVLTTRLNNLEGRCKLEFNPYRQAANEAVSECSNQFRLGHVLEANKYLQEVIAATSRVPAVFAPKELAMLRKQIEGEILDDNDKELQHYKALLTAHAPAFHIYLSFDCDPSPSNLDAPPTPPELPGRVHSALERKGWRILHEREAPPEIRAGKGVGMRLVVEVDPAEREGLEASLPALLAKDVSALLEKEQRADKQLAPSHSDAVTATRFKVTSVASSKGNLFNIDVRVLSRKLETDPHSSQFVANAVYRAVEQDSELLQTPILIRGCHIPYGTLHPRASGDFANKVRGKVQQCWAVVFVVTKRFYARAQHSAHTSKAGIEIAEAAQARGPGRVIALVAEELGPPPTWRGLLGKALGECHYVPFSSEKGWEAVVQALHNKVLLTGISLPTGRSPSTKELATEESTMENPSRVPGEVDGSAIGAAAFVTALKHSRAPAPGSAPSSAKSIGSGTGLRARNNSTSMLRSLALSRSSPKR